MSRKIDASGRRSVQSEAIIPGTPEQVWQAIATGPGVSSWFVPCQIEERVGGKITISFGPGMESSSVITSWNPPHSLSAEGSEMRPGGPVMATEWTVEARSGGTCVVRVVHSWFAETDEWDSQFEGTEHGWSAFFRDLALYVANFDGQPSKTFQLMAMTSAPQDEVWTKLTTALGLAGKAVGDQTHSPQGAPTLAGEVKYVAEAETLLLANQPGPGIAHFFAFDVDGTTYISARVFLYGTGIDDTVAKEEAVWSAWLAEHFPTPVPAEA
ncbi:MAG TPA: SRPBCC domain-containing protein [Fimbriimonadaceae bacterium]|nr:SRPBCC domain-containing protein [Fimbriimonadaceae bacterium]